MPVVGWQAATPQALTRLAGIADRYAARGVRVVAVDVGREPLVPPEGVELTLARGDAGVLRALRVLAVPSAVVVDTKAAVRAVLPGYDAMSLELEEALDALLPPEEPAE